MKSICLIVTAEVTALSFLKGFVRFLTDQGWSVTVIAASSGGLEHWASSEGGCAMSLDLERDPHLGSDYRALLRLFWLLRAMKPSIVVSATPKAGLLGMLAATGARVPVRVYELWGLRLETEHGLKRMLLMCLEWLAMACASQVWANSNSLAAAAVAMRLLPKRKIRVLGKGSSHGVDCEHFSRAQPVEPPASVVDFVGRSDGALIIGFIGRITRDKGLDTLLNAVRRCNEHGLTVRLLVVGDDEDPALFQRVSHECREGNVYLSPFVEDVRGYLSVMDVLCLPTLREGFPNVVLEAACMEIPSIVSNATGAIDSVVDGETGWVFQTGDVRGLASRIAWVAANRDAVRAVGCAARVYAVGAFSREMVWRDKESNWARLIRSVRDVQRRVTRSE